MNREAELDRLSRVACRDLFGIVNLTVTFRKSWRRGTAHIIRRRPLQAVKNTSECSRRVRFATCKSGLASLACIPLAGNQDTDSSNAPSSETSPDIFLRLSSRCLTYETEPQPIKNREPRSGTGTPNGCWLQCFVRQHGHNGSGHSSGFHTVACCRMCSRILAYRESNSACDPQR